MFVLPVASTQLGFQDLSANSHQNSCQLLQGFSIELICLLHLDPRHQSWLPNTFQYWYFSAILSLWMSPMSKQIKWSNSIHMHEFKQTSLKLNYNFEPPPPPTKKNSYPTILNRKILAKTWNSHLLLHYANLENIICKWIFFLDFFSNFCANFEEISLRNMFRSITFLSFWTLSMILRVSLA